MGRQVNFYALLADIADFEAMLQKAAPISFVSYVSSTRHVTVIDTLLRTPADPYASHIYLARTSDLSHVVLDHIKTQNHWVVDELRSPVVQLNKGTIIDRRIRRGRLHFDVGYYDSKGDWVEKPADFIEWADKLLRWIRRHYVKIPGYTEFIGPFALEAYQRKEVGLKRLSAWD